MRKKVEFCVFKQFLTDFFDRKKFNVKLIKQIHITDPEEFLTSLVAQILKAEPFLKLSSGQETYHYQLFVEKDDELNLPTVQQLLEQSFFASNIRLKEVPSVFIIQMPRFGKSFKMYPKIQPTLLLDITDIIEDC